MTLRLFPLASATGFQNMAADETLLLSAQAGEASLRFYTWTTATVSLGYFQPTSSRLAHPLLVDLPWVRRPTGGATLVHHHELTYALALPARFCRDTGPVWMRRMHTVFAEALAKFGVHAEAFRGTPDDHDDPLCFLQKTPGDLVLSGHKIMGSAQRRQRQCLLQHGSLLLAQSEFTPELPGIRELTGVSCDIAQLVEAITQNFGKATHWGGLRFFWTAPEMQTMAKLIATKYTQSTWNDKR